MIDTETLLRFESFLRLYHVSERLTKRLVDTARKKDGLPDVSSLRSCLNHIDSGIQNIPTLNFIIIQYELNFPSNVYRKKKTKEISLTELKYRLTGEI